ncbi:MAG: glycosyltransferase family 4 protein [Candidatus Methanofastidiosa archaeon]|nr:glycosyltransferase family 4 protein [Candidatus Methanofastidiosa archaeon]
MRILHINSYYRAGIFYKNLYDKQIENGLDIDVYVPVSASVDPSALKLGDYTNISVNHGTYDRFLFHLKHIKIYKDIVKKYVLDKYSLIHAHSLFSNGFIALKLKRNFGIPYVVAIRNTDVNTFFKYMIHLRKLGVQIISEAEKAIFLSKPYRNMVIEKFVPAKLKKDIFNKSEIIPNGIDDYWLSNKPAKIKSVKNNKINIVFVGQISRNKNVSTTINACKVLLRRGYNVKFTVVGRIKDKQEYQVIRAHDFVTYVEHQPKEKLIDLYRENDIFVMPSKTETFGLVYAEAMSQGLPVIYTKGQGFDGQFDEGEVGYSVTYNSAEEIADRVLDVLTNYEKISRNCIIKVDKFNWSKIAKEYIQIYSKYLKQ